MLVVMILLMIWKVFVFVCSLLLIRDKYGWVSYLGEERYEIYGVEINYFSWVRFRLVYV